MATLFTILVIAVVFTIAAWFADRYDRKFERKRADACNCPKRKQVHINGRA